MGALLMRQKEWVDKVANMRNTPNKFIVLNTDRFQKEDKNILELNIGIIDVCQTIAITNCLIKSVGGIKLIDDSIMYEAMKAIANSKKFTDKQLKKYFNFLNEFDQIRNLLVRINFDIDCVWIDPDVGLLLMGYTQEEIKKIYELSTDELHVEEFWELQGELTDRHLNFEEFLKKSREILNTILKSE